MVTSDGIVTSCMSGRRGFVDTNILVYAHDATAGSKRERASALLVELWNTGEGCLSVQVLQEFFVNVTRKVANPLDVGSAIAVIDDLSHWHVHAPNAQDVLAAAEIHRDAQISFWDAMILRSAGELGCESLYSEDLNAGQRFGNVTVHNPFADT
jgi:predicted nucleic acid-binding protein